MMNRPLLLPLLLTFPFAGSALAQQIVSPSQWTNIDSPSGNAFPLASNSIPYRYLNVHDDMAGNAGLIQELAMRRSGTTSTTAIPAFSVTVDVWMSTSNFPGGSLDATFDNNHGPDKLQVVTNTTISFPSVGTGLLPYDFDYAIPLQTPFPFAGTGPLAWELQTSARSGSASPLSLDSQAGASTNPSMVVSKYGEDGCTATGRTVPFALTGASSNQWGSGTIQINATAQDGPAGAIAALFIGFDRALTFALPLPGTMGFPSGTCYLQTDVVAQLPGTLNSSGDFTFRIPAAAMPTLNGVHVYSQAAAIDLGANALNVVTSNGLDHQIVAPYGATPGGRVYKGGLPNTTGTVDGQSLVVRFTY